MTVSSQTSTATFVGNGVATAFPLPFRFFENGDIRAYFIDSVTGAATQMVLGSDYTLIGAGEPEVDGNALSLLTTTVPLASMRGLYVERVMPQVQETDIVNQGEFFASTHEDVFDRLTMLIQQSNSNSQGVIRVAIGDPTPTRLPPAPQRALKLMSFDADGNPVAIAAAAQSATDLELRLAQPDGAERVGYGAGTVGGALDTVATVLDYGALCDGVTDDTVAATAMLADVGYVVFPRGRTCVIRNLALIDNAKVFAYGTLKLPAGCSDFDRLLYGASKVGLHLEIADVDGNYANQVGAIGTHLVYLTNCPGATVKLPSLRNHYIAAAAPLPSVDGIRNNSSGAVYLYRCHKATVQIGQLTGWGREGIYLEECNFATVGLDHAQGVYLTEYSGLQVKGVGNTVTHASVDNAGASGVGFDTTYGSISNIRSTNTRENHGVNFGHTGFPATGSVASNIVVEGAFVHGISVGAGTQDLLLANVSVYNAGELGINFSDGALRGNITSGFVEYSGQANINAYQANVQTRNVDTTRILPRSLKLTGVVGQFVEGETVTATGSTGAVGRVLNNLTGLDQRLLLSGSSGPFTVGGIVTGATSGATGTISTSIVPTEKLEAAGGKVVPEFERGGDINAGGAWVKHADGRLECQRLVNMNMTLLTTQTFGFPVLPVAGTPGGFRSLRGLGSASSLTADAAASLRLNDTQWEYTITASAGVVTAEPMMLTMIGRWF